MREICSSGVELLGNFNRFIVVEVIGVRANPNRVEDESFEAEEAFPSWLRNVADVSHISKISDPQR